MGVVDSAGPLGVGWVVFMVILLLALLTMEDPT